MTEEETEETTGGQKEIKQLLNDILNPLEAILTDFLCLNVTFISMYTYNPYHPYNTINYKCIIIQFYTIIQFIIKNNCNFLLKIYENLIDLYGDNDYCIQFQSTRKEFEGDITLVVFPFTKFSKTGPEETAKKIGDELISLSEIKSFHFTLTYSIFIVFRGCCDTCNTG